MRANGRLLGAGLICFALVFGSLARTTDSRAADDKEVREEVLKLADAVAKKAGGEAGQAEAIGKKGEVEDFMGLFRLRNKKGLGVGTEPGKIKPDGIEAIIMNVGKKAPRPAQLSSESEALAQAGHVAAAIALIVQNKCPVDKKQGEKDPQAWKNWSQEMYRSALDMAAAAEQKQPKQLQAAASKLNSTCNSCHGVFRD